MTEIGKGRSRITLAGVLALITVAYYPTLANFPVADSWVFLFPRSFFDTLGYFTRSVIPEVWNALWFRPLPMFTFWFDNLIWRGTFWGPHLTNLLIHLGNSILVWHLIRLFAGKSRGSSGSSVVPAFVATLMYGIHPLSVGAVAWIAARFDLLFVTLGLGSLIMWERWEKRSACGIPVACLLLLAASLLSKEQGVIITAMIVLLAVLGAAKSSGKRTSYLTTAVLAVVIFTIYFIYRLILFRGLGGYLDSQKVLSFRTPVGYLLALLFPYPNLVSGWHVSISLVLAVVILVVIIGYLWRYPQTDSAGERAGLIAPALLFVFGLATTAPHAGLTVSDILGHIESRFALVALTGFAVTLGRFLVLAGAAVRVQRIVLTAACIWGVTALWRTDVQITAWHASGETARNIVETVVYEIPDPPRSANFYFFGVPSYSSQFAYIFGIGLEEALMRQYPGRSDITVHHPAEPADLQHARPDVDAVFRFNKDTRSLERLRPQN